jgi:hypothetical protein
MAYLHRPSRRARTAHSVARGLGWFSIGLGVAELLLPRLMSRAVGMPGQERKLQAYGLREIATGVALLKARDPTPWLLARVGGDALDLATLGARGKVPQLNTVVALAAVAGVTAVDIATAQVLRSDAQRARQPVHDYTGRRGLPLPPSEMRGAALLDFDMPEDMRTPAALRAFVVES